MMISTHNDTKILPPERIAIVRWAAGLGAITAEALADRLDVNRGLGAGAAAGRRTRAAAEAPPPAHGQARPVHGHTRRPAQGRCAWPRSLPRERLERAAPDRVRPRGGGAGALLSRPPRAGRAGAAPRGARVPRRAGERARRAGAGGRRSTEAGRHSPPTRRGDTRLRRASPVRPASPFRPAAPPARSGAVAARPRRGAPGGGGGGADHQGARAPGGDLPGVGAGALRGGRPLPRPARGASAPCSARSSRRRPTSGWWSSRSTRCQAEGARRIDPGHPI